MCRHSATTVICLLLLTLVAQHSLGGWRHSDVLQVLLVKTFKDIVVGVGLCGAWLVQRLYSTATHLFVWIEMIYLRVVVLRGISFARWISLVLEIYLPVLLHHGELHFLLAKVCCICCALRRFDEPCLRHLERPSWSTVASHFSLWYQGWCAFYLLNRALGEHLIPCHFFRFDGTDSTWLSSWPLFYQAWRLPWMRWQNWLDVFVESLLLR